MIGTAKNQRRGRIAPSPTGLLHVGHALTFSTAAEQIRSKNGTLILRMEDIDPARCKNAYVQAALEDLRWWGIKWDEGPDIGGPNAPYTQSMRVPSYLNAWKILLQKGLIYPSPHSRKEIISTLELSGSNNLEDPVFPKSLRCWDFDNSINEPGNVNWRFKVPDNTRISFQDHMKGKISYLTGVDFGDFLVWRKDGVPSYELAVVADDIEMKITDVVRGEDLLLSTARQLLLYEAFASTPPFWYHLPLVTDRNGQKLSKSLGSISLQQLRNDGTQPKNLDEIASRLDLSIPRITIAEAASDKCEP